MSAVVNFKAYRHCKIRRETLSDRMAQAAMREFQSFPSHVIEAGIVAGNTAIARGVAFAGAMAAVRRGVVNAALNSIDRDARRMAAYYRRRDEYAASSMKVIEQQLATVTQSVDELKKAIARAQHVLDSGGKLSDAVVHAFVWGEK